MLRRLDMVGLGCHGRHITHKLVATNGRNGLQRKLMQFDAAKVQPEQAARCREILNNYTVHEAQTVSAGAATFYVWGRGVMDDVEKNNPALGQPVEYATIY